MINQGDIHPPYKGVTDWSEIRGSTNPWQITSKVVIQEEDGTVITWFPPKHQSSHIFEHGGPSLSINTSIHPPIIPPPSPPYHPADSFNPATNQYLICLLLKQQEEQIVRLISSQMHTFVSTYNILPPIKVDVQSPYQTPAQSTPKTPELQFPGAPVCQHPNCSTGLCHGKQPPFSMAQMILMWSDSLKGHHKSI